MYLRWRPRRFAEVVGQEAVTRTLRNAVVRDTVAHAYLLCGPRGTGKTSIARILYRALNCDRPDAGEPCGACASCEAAETGRAVDLIEMDAASHGGVDDVRELRERVHFAPVQARVKVYIVDEAHQLTAKAWDAFLKTLEEPPPRTVFVLATTEAHKVPGTIVSRCQRFDLKRIPQARIEQHLQAVAESEGITLDPAVAERLSRLARGSLRDAIGMLEQVAAFSGTAVTMEGARSVLGLVRGDALRSFLDALSLREPRRPLELLEDLVLEGADLRQFLEELVSYIRSALLVRSGAGAALEARLGVEERTWLEEIAHRWAPGEIISILRAYGEIETRGRDEQQVLARLELVTAWATGLRSEGPAGGARQQIRQEEARDAAAADRGRDEAGRDAPVELIRPGEEPEALPPVQSGSPVGLIRPGEEPEALPPVQSGSPAGETALSPQPGAREAGLGPPAGTDAPAPLPRPSLAVLQARWPSLVERFSGTLFAKLKLHGLAPVALDQDLITVEGPLALLDLQRLSAPECRQALEELFLEEFQVALRVRFQQQELAPAGAGALAELGAALFGGQVTAEESGDA